MSTDPTLTYQEQVAGARPAAETRAVFGQVMGLVAFTVGFFALGAYIGRDISGGAGILCMIGAIVLFVALNFVVRRSEQAAIAILFGAGLLLGIGLGPVLNEYAQSDPSALWQAGGATAVFVAGLGAYGYATRRDLSSWARTLFWALLAFLGLGLVFIFVNIPAENIIWSVLGLVIFGAYTIFDFNRLRRAGQEWAVPIAAGIFLDVVNIFLFFLQIFGGGRD